MRNKNKKYKPKLIEMGNNIMYICPNCKNQLGLQTIFNNRKLTIKLKTYCRTCHILHTVKRRKVKDLNEYKKLRKMNLSKKR